MISTSALCFVLALSSTSASIQKGTVEEELTDKISSVVADKLIEVANNASTNDTGEAELETMILDTIRDVLDEQMKPEMKELKYVSDDSPDQVAENLADKISENAMPSDGKVSPRSFLGSIVKTVGKAALKELAESAFEKIKEKITNKHCGHRSCIH